MKGRYVQTFSDKRAEVDEQINSYMEETLFGDASVQKKEKKYSMWLQLCDKKDNKTNRKAFESFCKENNVTW